MKKFTFLVFVILGALAWSCGGGGSQSKDKYKEVNGGRFEGGIFYLNESENVISLFPPSILDASSYRTATQIFEGLYKFDQKTLG